MNFEFFSFFIFWFHNQNWKTKESFEIHFLISNQVMNSKILIFIFWNWFYIKIDSKKLFFFRFSFFNSIMKFEKWKIFFETRFSITNQKTNYKILKFFFSFFFLKWVTSKFVLRGGFQNKTKITLSLDKLFKTFTVAGWRLKWIS